MVRKAEVELRESTYYPLPETRRHLSETASNLRTTERRCARCSGSSETPGEFLSRRPARGQQASLQ
jgi:hypothetical protein